MSTKSDLIDDAIFEESSTHITVHRTEHNGKIWTHHHSFYELVYVDTGFALHTQNGKTAVVTQGNLFIIRPNEFHSYAGAYHHKIYNCLFSEEELSSVRTELLELPGMKALFESGENLPVLHIDLSMRGDVTQLLDRMSVELQERTIGWELNVKSQLISLLVLYSRLYSAIDISDQNKKSGYYGYVFKALEYIETHYQEDITGKDIAQCTGLSQDYVAKQFKSVLSMTPSEYIRRYRVSKAMELLKSTDMSAAEISRAVGFGDISLFSRVFKQLAGMSPTAFRRNAEV